MRDNWAGYLNRLMGERSQADFARLLGVTDGQLSKWRSGTSGHKVETVIEIARKLGDSPLHALVVVGYLDPDDVARFRIAKPYALDEYTDLELSSEIVRRIANGTASRALTDPLEIEDDGHRIRPVLPLHPAVEHEEWEEAASETIRPLHEDDTDDKYDA